MAREVDLDEAKTHLSRLPAEVDGGEEVVIGRAGTPIARLVPYQHPATPRRPGAWKGRVRIADDVDELPDDVAAAFRGERV